MTKPAVFAIHGTFFQSTEAPAIVHGAELEGGTHVELRQLAMSHAFSGNFMTHGGSSHGEGVMIDSFGPSRITVMRRVNGMQIEKQYRNAALVYVLKSTKTPDLYEGEYYGGLVGSGKVRCIITELPESLFNLTP
jgi:hypothetical protein